MGGFAPIAELYATLGLDADRYNAGLAAAKKEFASLAEFLGAGLNSQQNALSEIASLIGGDYANSFGKAKREVQALSEQLAKQALESSAFALKGNEAHKLIIQGYAEETATVLTLQKYRQEAAADEKRLDKEITEFNKEHRAQRKEEEASYREWFKGNQAEIKASFEATASERLRVERFTADLTKEIEQQLTAQLRAEDAERLLAEKLRQDLSITQAKEASEIMIALKKDEALNFKLTIDRELLQQKEASQIMRAMREDELRHKKEIDRQKAESASLFHKQEKIMAAESASFQTQVMRGLALSTWFMGGRAGFIAGLAGMAGPVAAGTTATVIGMGEAAKATIEFSNALTQGTANMRGASEEMKNNLGDEALKMGRNFGISSLAIVKGFEQMVQAGYDAGGALAAIEPIAKFAFATNSDYARSVELVTAAQKAWKLDSLDAAKNAESLTLVTSILAQAEQLGGQSALEMATAMAAAGSQAEKSGITFNEAAAAIAVLGLKNFDGSRSGEILAQVLGRLESVSVRNSKAWKELGLSMTNTDGSAKPLSKVLDELTPILGSNDQAANAAAGKMLGLETRTAKFLSLLLSEGGRINNFTGDLSGLSKIMDEIIEKRLDTPATQWDKLAEKLKSYAIAVGKPFGEVITFHLKAVNDYLESTERFLDVIVTHLKELDASVAGPRGPSPNATPNISGSDISNMNALMQSIMGASTAKGTWNTLDLAALDTAKKRFAAEKNNAEVLAEQWAIVQRGYADGKVTEAEYQGMKIKHAQELKRLTDNVLTKDKELRSDLLLQEESLNVQSLEGRKGHLQAQLAANHAAEEREIEQARDKYGKLVGMEQELQATITAIRGIHWNQRSQMVDAALAKEQAAKTAAGNKEYNEQQRLEEYLGNIDADFQERRLLKIVEEETKQRELKDTLAEIREQSAEGQVNKYTLAIARINKAAEDQFDHLWKLYGQDEQNWNNLQEAKIRIDEIAGQKRRAVIEAQGRELQNMFHRLVDNVDSFGDFAANVFDEMAGYFEDAVFKMVAAWRLGQSEMVTTAQSSGGLGGWIGIFSNLIGGLLGGGTAAPNLTAGLASESAGDVFMSLPAYAAGGMFGPGLAVVGEHGPEVVNFGASGNITPANALGGTQITNYIDARGTDPATAQRMIRALEETQRKSVQGAVIATREMALRGSS